MLSGIFQLVLKGLLVTINSSSRLIASKIKVFVYIIYVGALCIIIIYIYIYIHTHACIYLRNIFILYIDSNIIYKYFIYK